MWLNVIQERQRYNVSVLSVANLDLYQIPETTSEVSVKKRYFSCIKINAVLSWSNTVGLLVFL